MAIRKTSLGKVSKKSKNTKKTSDSYYESDVNDEYDNYEDSEDDEDDEDEESQWKIDKSKKKTKSKSSFLSKEDEYNQMMATEDSLSDFLRIIELEKEDLYDYIFRMTGRCDDTSKIVKETASAMRSNYKKLKTYLDFKIALYSTARNFAADDWNSLTEKLENPGYAELNAGALPRSKQRIRLIEKTFQSIDKSWIKEALLLRYRYMFSPSEAATIMSSSVTTVKSFEEAGLKFISSSTKMSAEEIKQIIPQFPEYSFISTGSMTTKALSQVMGSIKKDSNYNRGFWFTLLRVMVLVAIGAGIYYLYDNYLRYVIDRF